MLRNILALSVAICICVHVCVANDKCCQKGIEHSKISLTADCSADTVLTGKDRDDSVCGIMFEMCCNSAREGRKCEMGITFARAGRMCPYSDVLAAQCCKACKNGSERSCDNEYSGSGNAYAKTAFKRCCKQDSKKDKKDDDDDAKKKAEKEKQEKKKEELEKKKKQELEKKKKEELEKKKKEELEKKKKEELEKKEKEELEKKKKEELEKKKKEASKKKCNCDSNKSTGCKQTDDGPQCICKNGYQLKSDGTCEDINECEVGPPKYQCDSRYWCWNEVGHFRCVYECPVPRYKQRKINNRRVCEDTDECAEGTHKCNKETHECINVVGGHKCKRVRCEQGFKMVDGDRCEEINACETATCGDNEYCYNVYGNAHCIKQDCPNNKYYEKRLSGNNKIKECVKTKCDQIRDKQESDKCWQTAKFPSSIKRYAYRFQKKLKYDEFKFNYWWDFNRNEYDVDIRISEGNRGNEFYINFDGDTRLNIMNHKVVVGPRELQFTMKMDVTSRRYRNLVWRYQYKFYVYVSA